MIGQLQDIPWTDFKQIIDDRNLSVQWVDVHNTYWLKAIDGPFEIDCILYKDGSADQTDFENNYKAKGNQPPDISIREEQKKTGGHYQASGFEFDVGAGDSTKEISISFPHPVSLLAAEWANKSDFDGDSIEFVVSPDTVIGTLSADEASGQTVLSVSQTVIDNTDVGYMITLTDGTNTNACGRIKAIDTGANTIEVETATTDSFAAATPTYVKQTVCMLAKSKLDTSGRVQLGESKIGGSYIPAGTVLKAIYYNDAATAKKLRFFLEYLY